MQPNANWSCTPTQCQCSDLYTQPQEVRGKKRGRDASLSQRTASNRSTSNGPIAGLAGRDTHKQGTDWQKAGQAHRTPLDARVPLPNVIIWSTGPTHRAGLRSTSSHNLVFASAFASGLTLFAFTSWPPCWQQFAVRPRPAIPAASLHHDRNLALLLPLGVYTHTHTSHTVCIISASGPVFTTPSCP